MAEKIGPKFHDSLDSGWVNPDEAGVVRRELSDELHEEALAENEKRDQEEVKARRADRLSGLFPAIGVEGPFTEPMPGSPSETSGSDDPWVSPES